MAFSASRRGFLRTAIRTAGAGVVLSALPLGMRRAFAIPADHRAGSVQDVEHIVIFMQENRAFDHYFGVLKGVRGFGDTRVIRLPNGKPVWYQPRKWTGQGEVLPFRPSAPDLGMQFMQDLPHDWESTHNAWNGGRYDQWVPVKGAETMAHMTRDDIPYHYRLADLFTICDAYHCSVLGPTFPNRYYMWTGWAGNDGSGGGPALNDAIPGFSWSTYPEVLQRAGISWRIYQDVGLGLNEHTAWGWVRPGYRANMNHPYVGNFGCNVLLDFDRYREARPGSPLYDNARRGTDFLAGDGYLDDLRHDVENDTLPQVCWIVMPQAFSEHPNWPANYGAWYIDQVLQALTSNAKVWSRTVMFLNYDENDGFFDHVPPPFAAVSTMAGGSTVDTKHEFYPGSADFMAGSYGLGPRVPTIVISPWSKGGWVCSEVFDHTSLIRFIETRFGRDHDVIEPQITAWRRAVCGDLTSAFDFANPNSRVPELPSTSAYAPVDRKPHHPSYFPVPPTVQAVPKQEPGVRPARPLPYVLHVHANDQGTNDKVEMTFTNAGTAGANFLLYRADGYSAPASYTVEPGKRLVDYLSPDASGHYEFSVHGPNGFLRRFVGRVTSARGSNAAWLRVDEVYDTARESLQLELENLGPEPCDVTISDAYNVRDVVKRRLRRRDHGHITFDLRTTNGWYDLTVTSPTCLSFERRLAGHIETGGPSMSDPALGS